MAFFDVGPWQGDAFACEHTANSSILDSEELVRLDQPPMPKIRIGPELLGPEDKLTIENPLYKIRLPEFPTDRPWLPQEAVAILEKIKKKPVREKELITLMDLVAEQVTTHFQLQHGKFVASTYSGRIIEVSDTRVGLLKKIQRSVFTEEMFVWRVGFPSFSGRT